MVLENPPKDYQSLTPLVSNFDTCSSEWTNWRDLYLFEKLILEN